MPNGHKIQLKTELTSALMISILINKVDNQQTNNTLTATSNRYFTTILYTKKDNKNTN